MPEQKREAVELLASSNVVGGSYVPPHMRGQVIQINLSLLWGSNTWSTARLQQYQYVIRGQVKQFNLIQQKRTPIYWVYLNNGQCPVEHPRQNSARLASHQIANKTALNNL